MNCDQARTLKHAYADGELDVVLMTEFEGHLKNCPQCRQACENLQALRSSIQDAGLYCQAPAGLARRIRTALPAPDPGGARRWTFAVPWLKLVLPLSTAALAVALLLIGISRGGQERRLVQEVTASHIRSLMASHLTDVASSDQHTVKPWFSGKLDFSPGVVDLSGRGFPLVGGRLDYLDNHSAAALVYQRRKHWISLFVWPASRGGADTREQTTSLHGYNVVFWNQAGLENWAVSDLNPTELREFVQAVRTGH